MSLDEPSPAPAGNHASGIHQNKYPAQDDEHNYSRGNWELASLKMKVASRKLTVRAFTPPFLKTFPALITVLGYHLPLSAIS